MVHLLSRFSRSFVKQISGVKNLRFNSSALAPLANRFFIFNFIEPAVTNDKDVEEKWTKAADYVIEKEKAFVSTYLHKTSDPNARFRWINFAVLNSDDAIVFGKPDPNWAELTQTAMQGTARARPAGYQEIASYKGNALVADTKQSPETSAFLVTAVQVNDSISDEEFESNWKKMSGTELLHSKLDPETIADSILYRRFLKMAPDFRYAVRSEIKNTDDATGYQIAQHINSSNSAAGVQTSTGYYRVAIQY